MLIKKCPGAALWDVFDNEARIHRNEGREEKERCVVDELNVF